MAGSTIRDCQGRTRLMARGTERRRSEGRSTRHGMTILAVSVEPALGRRGVDDGQEWDGMVRATLPGEATMVGPMAIEGAAGLRRNVIEGRIAQGRHGTAGRPFHLSRAQEFKVVCRSSCAIGHDVALSAQRVDGGTKVFGMQPREKAVVLGNAQGCTQRMALAATSIGIWIDRSGLPTGC